MSEGNEDEAPPEQPDFETDAGAAGADSDPGRAPDAGGEPPPGSAAADGAEEETALEEVLDPLTAMTIERDEYLDPLRRGQGEFENYKKRMLRQQTEQLDRAAEGLVTKMLPALDTLSLALSHTDTDASEE